MENYWNIGIEIDPKKKEVLLDIALETKFKLTLPHVSVHIKGFEPRFSNKTHFKIRIGLKNSEPEWHYIDPDTAGCEDVLELTA